MDMYPLRWVKYLPMFLLSEWWWLSRCLYRCLTVAMLTGQKPRLWHWRLSQRILLLRDYDFDTDFHGFVNGRDDGCIDLCDSCLFWWRFTLTLKCYDYWHCIATIYLWLCDCDCERERVTVTVWVALTRGMWLLPWLWPYIDVCDVTVMMMWLCIYMRLWHCSVMCLSPTTYDVDMSHCAFDFALVANLTPFLRWTMFQMDRGLWPNRCCVRIQLNNWSLWWKRMPRLVRRIWAIPPSRKSWAVM